MAVGLTDLPVLHPIAGIHLGTATSGMGYVGRDDLAVISCDPGTVATAVFTRNRFVAAPVEVARDHLGQASPQALLINAGNANAGTGAEGVQAATACCEALAGLLGCDSQEVLPFSTGVIGEPLAVDRLTQALPECVKNLNVSGWQAAAMAMMTTDTLAKGCSRQFDVDGIKISVTGIVKGAGMIQPNMATMLAFIATDAPVSPTLLDALLQEGVAQSFNRITVDGDMSTNDACVLLATGQAGIEPISEVGGAAYEDLKNAIEGVLRDLAQAVVRDAEGATKFITVSVEGAEDESESVVIAYTIANSPLVKTACFASDPNWGRILAAVGRAPVAELDIHAVAIYLDDVRVVSQGCLDPDYREQDGQAVMDKPEFEIRVVVGTGPAAVKVWTCDLSHDYIKINAEYRS
ncbi:MAG TPA: bifunctional glutamate N-acetyltransferase/amino-acid acetyltransferase ArgJ [Acidiferrobacteraceae bacterium]|nr:bifunctional glutamate N-acetyltransferase/amino-acid acetyltransferase ArgJ [Acidiferrobacteraceae bacterium]